MPYITYNSKSPKVKGLNIFGDNEVPKYSYKYADIEWLYPKLAPRYQVILDNAPITRDYRYTLVDFKVQNLIKGKPTCLPGWHLDGPGHPLNPAKPETFHLAIFGNDAPTEFISEPITIWTEDYDDWRNMGRQLDRKKNINYKSVPMMCWNTYGRFDWHRGPIAKNSGLRILIRITETDIIMPRNKPFVPYTEQQHFRQGENNNEQ